MLLYYQYYFFLAGFVVNNFYRPYAYQKVLEDYGFADAGVNVFVVPCLVTFMMAIKKPKEMSKKRRLAFSVIGLYISVELMNYFFPFIGVFDPKDIVAYLIGGILSILILYYVEGKEFISLDGISKY